jgi:class 3 adenylate cyclase
MKLMVLAALLVAGLLSVILAIVVSRQLTRPIRDLVKLCRAIASRDFDQRAQIETRDEMAMLGRTLNDAAGQLRDSEEELRRQQAIRADLGRYLPTEVVERIAEDGDLSELDGRREQVSILFADVVGFTQLCEQNEPDVVVAVLNELFTIITEIIFRHQGVVDKFIGDCVMAFWGAPDADPEHAFHAVSAAEDIISWLEIGNAGWREKYGVEIQLAVGVHSGDVIVGNVGSNNRVAYTVVGEAVNLAARLESIARPNQILTSRQTAELVADDFDIVHVGGRRMPGSDDEVELYEVRV